MSKKIKQVRRFSQAYKNFSFSELMTKADEEYLEATLEMDTLGNVLSESKFDRFGELEERNTMTYSEEGKLLDHTLFYALDDVSEKRVLERDDKGRLVKETKFYGDDSGESTVYAYNDKDQLSEIREFDEEGTFVSLEMISFDESGSLVKRAKYGEGQVLLEYIEYMKTGEDKVMEERTHDADGNLQTINTLTFNDDGKELSSYLRNAEGKLITGVITTYDEKGNISERKTLDFHSRTVKYTYDDQNRVLTQELYDVGGLLVKKNVYEYDEDGNLIVEQAFEMDNSRGAKEKHYGTRYEYEYYS